MKKDIPTKGLNHDSIFVARDFFGVAGVSLLDRMNEGTKRERRNYFNSLVYLGKVSGVLPTNINPIFAGSAADANGNYGIIFVYESTLAVGGLIE